MARRKRQPAGVVVHASGQRLTRAVVLVQTDDVRRFTVGRQFRNPENGEVLEVRKVDAVRVVLRRDVRKMFPMVPKLRACDELVAMKERKR